MNNDDNATGVNYDDDDGGGDDNGVVYGEIYDGIRVCRDTDKNKNVVCLYCKQNGVI